MGSVFGTDCCFSREDDPVATVSVAVTSASVVDPFLVNSPGTPTTARSAAEVTPRTVTVQSPRRAQQELAKEENNSFAQTMNFLAHVPLFKRLPKDQHPLLAAACSVVDFKAGQVIIKQGEAGNEFFVICSGGASVTVDGNKAAELQSGDYFGENALLHDEPRRATITADGLLSAFKITRDKFQELGLNKKLQFANRRAVGAGGGGRVLEIKPPSPKNDTERSLIADALRRNSNLQTMVTLDDARVKQMIDVAWKEEVPAGKEIITEGDLNADYFYVVQEGTFEIFVLEQVDTTEKTPHSAEEAIKQGESKFASSVTKGGSFGELALLYAAPRAATVKAKSDAIVWVIDRQNFKKILWSVSDQKLLEYVKYLDTLEILGPLWAEEKKALASVLFEMHFTEGEVILQQGEPGKTFYILYDGEVSVIKDGAEQTKLTASPSSQTTQFFGERALMNNAPRAATVQVSSSTAKALALDRDDFDMLLGPLLDIIKRSSDTRWARPHSLKTPQGSAVSVNLNDTTRDKILCKDLRKVGLLGCGGFGAVELYEHKKTGETYAMKSVSKGYIVKMGMQQGIKNEKKILMMTNSPFIIRLYECYSDSQTLCFLMEPALGGELFAIYIQEGFYGSEKHAKFYAAGVVYAFEHCHERRIIYRDLKPENVLLNEVGQVKLTDMGLAKFVVGKTYSTCGTPDYFAPEVIASTGHTNAVDWWTLGILVFELMSGHPPFESERPMQIYTKVKHGIGKVRFPSKCRGPVGDLIKALLKNEPSERLPMRAGGTNNVRNHKWYNDFDWTQMKALGLDPPYKPVVNSKKDIANFSALEQDMPPQIEYKDDGTGWDMDFAT